MFLNNALMSGSNVAVRLHDARHDRTCPWKRLCSKEVEIVERFAPVSRPAEASEAAWLCVYSVNHGDK